SFHVVLPISMVGGHHRPLFSRRCSSGSRRSRAFRDTLGLGGRPFSSVFCRAYGPCRHRGPLSLFHAFLQVKILRLDLSDRNHVLLLSIVSQLHLLLGLSPCL